MFLILVIIMVILLILLHIRYANQIHPIQFIPKNNYYFIWPVRTYK